MDDKSSESRPVVLIVDDSPTVLETAAALLDDDFYVLKAHNGNAALEILRATHADVVCTDYQMPGMTGVELLRKVAVLPDPPVGALVTAYRNYDRSTGDDYHVLFKPYDPDKLVEFVTSIAKVAQMRRALRKLRK